MRVKYKLFRSMFSSWETLFTQAAEFADRIPPERLISISHSADKGDGVVTVWYWEVESAPSAIAAVKREAAAKTDRPGTGNACMACGEPIPERAEKCPACGWSWNAGV